MKVGVWLVVCLLSFVAVAEAGLEPRFATAFASPGGPLSVNWRVKLVTGALEPGASFSQHMTIYDIPNLIPGVSRQPADWVATFQTLGLDADEAKFCAGEDSGTYLNVTWKWVGTKRIVAPFELGVFGIDQSSIGGAAMQNLFAAQVTRTHLPAGARIATVGRVNGARLGASLYSAPEVMASMVADTRSYVRPRRRSC
jgi:hypothetical protein